MESEAVNAARAEWAAGLSGRRKRATAVENTPANVVVRCPCGREHARELNSGEALTWRCECSLWLRLEVSW